jgi:hypothetical protein
MHERLTQYQSYASLLPIIRALFRKRARSIFASAFRNRPIDIPTALLTPLVEFIAQHRFPIVEWDLSYVLDSFPWIPTQPMNYDETSEFDDEPLAVGLLAACCGYYENAPPWSDIQHRLGPTIRLPTCFEDNEHHCHFPSSAFDTLCLNEPSPVRELPILRQLIYHETDLYFLDSASAYRQEGHEFQWTLSNIKTLTQDWRASQKLTDVATRCARALDAEPHHWTTIFHHWTTACQNHPESNS